jgi:tetratricopeptide (TPR) repeat protein
MVLVIGALSLRTIARVSDWHDPLTLYTHDIRFNDTNPDLFYDYGTELLKNGEFDGAILNLRHVIAMDSSWWIPYSVLGSAYSAKGEMVEAAHAYGEALQRMDAIEMYIDLGQAYSALPDARRTVSFLEKAVQKYPNSRALRDLLTIAYYKSGQYRESRASAAASSSLKEPFVVSPQFIRLKMVSHIR